MQQCTDRGWYCLDTYQLSRTRFVRVRRSIMPMIRTWTPSGNRLLEDLVHNYIIQKQSTARQTITRSALESLDDVKYPQRVG